MQNSSNTYPPAVTSIYNSQVNRPLSFARNIKIQITALVWMRMTFECIPNITILVCASYIFKQSTSFLSLTMLFRLFYLFCILQSHFVWRYTFPNIQTHHRLPHFLWASSSRRLDAFWFGYIEKNIVRAAMVYINGSTHTRHGFVNFPWKEIASSTAKFFKLPL